MLFMSDLSCGNWGHVSDNRKLRSQPSAGKKAPLITQTRHHGQTHGGAHSDWPWLMSYGSVFTNITDTAVTVSQCVCVCVHFCQCVFFSGSWVIRNNWRKSSINFTHPGTLCGSLTLWAPVCWAIIHSWCTVVSVLIIHTEGEAVLSTNSKVSPYISNSSISLSGKNEIFLFFCIKMIL